MVPLLLALAVAGTGVVPHHDLHGTGTVNGAVSLAEYEGAAVVLTPRRYPVKVVGVDVFSFTYMGGPDGQAAAYQLDLWDERGGRVDPPRRFDGGYYAPTQQHFVQ